MSRPSRLAAWRAMSGQADPSVVEAFAQGPLALLAVEMADEGGGPIVVEILSPDQSLASFEWPNLNRYLGFQ